MVFEGNRIALDTAYFRGLPDRETLELVKDSLDTLEDVDPHNRWLIEDQLLQYIHNRILLATKGGALIKAFHRAAQGSPMAKENAPLLLRMAVLDSDMISPDAFLDKDKGFAASHSSH